jgi:hypothetical protein
MTDLGEINVEQEIEKLSRDWASLERATDRTVSLAEVVRSLNNLGANLIEFRQHVLALYDAANLLTSHLQSTELAATAWASSRHSQRRKISKRVFGPASEALPFFPVREAIPPLARS